MVRLLNLRALRVLSVVLVVVLSNSISAVEVSAEPEAGRTAASTEGFSDTDKAALLLPQDTSESQQPLYAGTSTWFLLSIAVLGSIAVQRRSDSPD